MDLLRFMAATPEVSPVCSPSSTRGRPTTPVPQMDAVMDSCGVPPHLILNRTRNIPSVQRRMVFFINVTSVKLVVRLICDIHSAVLCIS